MELPREDKPVDITNPQVFAFLACICIAMGLLLGFGCSWLFYEVSHPVVWNGARATATEIAPIHGVMMIIILAATGLMIALTAAYVPRWVRDYYEQKKIPEWILHLHSWGAEIISFLKEKS